MSNTPQFNGTPDFQKQCAIWLESLTVENRLSSHTVASYARDLAQFIDFLADHYARPPALADMSALQLADLRAFLAARRRTGAQSRSLNRSVSGLRNFARFLERRDTPVSPAFNLLSLPKYNSADVCADRLLYAVLSTPNMDADFRQSQAGVFK